MTDISQTILTNTFSWIKMYKLRSIFHWRLFLMAQLTLFQHWFRQWLGAFQATSHYLNRWWLVYWRIYVSLGLNELCRMTICGVWCWNALEIGMRPQEEDISVFYDKFIIPQITPILSFTLFLCWHILERYSSCCPSSIGANFRDGCRRNTPLFTNRWFVNIFVDI